jgi:hypothetical protein
LDQVGDPLNHASGRQLGDLIPGDRLWILSAHDDRLFLVGPLAVGRIMNGREARQRYGPGLWQAPHHVGASPGTIVRIAHVDITSNASRLRFIGPRPVLHADRRRWAMALRRVRQLSSRSASLLERLWRKGAGQRLPEPISAAESAALEGLMTETVRYSRRRSGLLRAEALRRAGGVCAACGRQYSTYLDGLGERVLQVHHRRQLAATDVPRLTRSSDLAVLCANCHALVHSNPQRSLPVERLRTMIQAAPNPPLQLAGYSRS